MDAPRDPALPFPIERSLVDLAKYPFPDESPAGGPEATAFYRNVSAAQRSPSETNVTAPCRSVR